METRYWLLNLSDDRVYERSGV